MLSVGMGIIMIIALIDNNEQDLEISNFLIENEIKKYTNNYAIDKINDPNVLDLNKCYDVLLLEVEMPKNGIELAKEYLIYHKKTKIIFISNNIERVFDIFDVHPFYFIKKENLKIFISKVIKSLIDKIGIDNSHLSVNTIYGLTNISLNKIKYIKSDKHYCLIFTTDEIYKVRDTIDNILLKIVSKNFSRIHQSTIINWQYVEEFKYNTIKIDQEYLSVSRTYLSKCKKAYTIFINSPFNINSKNLSNIVNNE